MPEQCIEIHNRLGNGIISSDCGINNFVVVMAVVVLVAHKGRKEKYFKCLVYQTTSSQRRSVDFQTSTESNVENFNNNASVSSQDFLLNLLFCSIFIFSLKTPPYPIIYDAVRLPNESWSLLLMKCGRAKWSKSGNLYVKRTNGARTNCNRCSDSDSCWAELNSVVTVASFTSSPPLLLKADSKCDKSWRFELFKRWLR